jgi:hypothetical protein
MMNVFRGNELRTPEICLRFGRHDSSCMKDSGVFAVASMGPKLRNRTTGVEEREDCLVDQFQFIATLNNV